MEIETVMMIVTMLVTILCGFISKKCPKINNKLIPIQNLLIGLIVASIEWVVTKDFKTAIALSGILAGGSYDIVHNINKLIESEED